MISIIGAGFLVARLLGMAIIIVTVLCAILYHMGWRNDHPDGFWPIRSVLGFGGVLCAGVGLFVGSIMLLVLGFVAYLAGLMFGGEPRATA